MVELKTPILKEQIKQLKVGEQVYITGDILCGRDAVLPKIVELIKTNKLKDSGIELEGSVVFHTAVSKAGVGPTSSNKYEIESSFEELSRAGVRIHLGKGQIQKETIEGLKKNDSAFAVIPPVSALLGANTKESQCIAFEELGMEALYRLRVERYPAIIGAVNGGSIYDR